MCNSTDVEVGRRGRRGGGELQGAALTFTLFETEFLVFPVSAPPVSAVEPPLVLLSSVSRLLVGVL